MAWVWVGIAVMMLSVTEVLAMWSSVRVQRTRVQLPMAMALAALVIGECVAAVAVPQAGRWRYALLIAQGEISALVVAYLAVVAHPTRIFPKGKLARLRRWALNFSIRSRMWRSVMALGRPAPALALFGASVVSWQVLVPWVAGVPSVALREAYVLGSLLAALPFWCHVFPLSSRPVLGPGARAAYVGAAAMVANVANIVQLSGLPVVARASVSPAALLGPRLAVAMLLTGASGFLALVLIFLVVRWLQTDQEAHPPKPSHRAPLQKTKASITTAAGRTRYGTGWRSGPPGEVVPLWPDEPDEPGGLPKKGYL